MKLIFQIEDKEKDESGTEQRTTYIANDITTNVTCPCHDLVSRCSTRIILVSAGRTWGRLSPHPGPTPTRITTPSKSRRWAPVQSGNKEEEKKKRKETFMLKSGRMWNAHNCYYRKGNPYLSLKLENITVLFYGWSNIWNSGCVSTNALSLLW